MNCIGKYEIVRKLGNGTTSTVYLALDQFNNQQVALKVFKPDALPDSSHANAYRKLMLTEASLAGKLSHPHIVKMFDAVLDGELNYMVMEYVEGETLEKFTSADRLLPFGTIAEIIYKCCNALEYAQQQGVIHRDIKPANILMQGDGDIKIVDFGAAQIDSQRVTQMTLVAGIGSPAYMSPEQIQEHALTYHTDIYSLGVTLYSLLTGRLPFHADNSYSLLNQIVHDTPPPPRSLRPDIPVALDAIAQRAMQKDLSQRYQTWAEFSGDLVQFFNQNVEEEEQADISDTKKFNTLRSLLFFKNVGDAELLEVLRISNWRKVHSGDCILNEGGQDRAFFILTSGMVKVLKHGRMLNMLYKGDCFGGMNRFPDSAFLRTTAVVANTDATLIEIRLDALDKASVECRFQFDDAFQYFLLKRLDVANTRISNLLDKRGN
jgi:serine/threonine protein kinase